MSEALKRQTFLFAVAKVHVANLEYLVATRHFRPIGEPETPVDKLIELERKILDALDACAREATTEDERERSRELYTEYARRVITNRNSR